MPHSSPPPQRSGGSASGGAASASSPPPAFTGPSILATLQGDDVGALDRLHAFVRSGEVRDLDDEELWGRPALYSCLAGALRAAWRKHDHAALGGVSDDEHENFVYDEQQRAKGSGSSSSDGSRTRRADSGFDDEEDEQGPSSRHDPSFAVQEAWARLVAVYAILGRMIALPEFQPDLARRKGALDASFAGQLLARFEPKFKKRGATANQAGATGGLTHAQLATMTGIGGVAIGSRGGGGGGGSGGSGMTAVAPASMFGGGGGGGGLVKFPDPESPTPQELSTLRGLVHSVYTRLAYLRPTLRSLMGNFLARFLRTSTYPQGLNEILAVYGAIVRGFTLPLHAQHRDFLLKNLLPLHQPNQMINETSPVLSVYHESLVYVLIQFLEKEQAATAAAAARHAAAEAKHHHTHAAAAAAAASPSLCEVILTRILLGWPNAKAANSPKEVLLLHECEKILEYCPTDQQASSDASSAASAAAAPAASSSAFHRIISQFMPYLIQCISSYNHRVSERALQLWQNDKFLSLCSADRAFVLPAVLPALVNEEKHWNKSVNKMRGIVMSLFREMDLMLFTRVAHQYYTALWTASQPVGSASASSQPPFSPSDSLARIDALILSLRPPESLVVQSADSVLLATQIRVATHLPAQVKYSDFVFGHLLGEGSFSQVRYAKWIQRGQLPSAWPEFAVKILNKELVAQQKYEMNLEREIRIMNRLAHENINRLVALCDNATNTYLVLEYASKGDLHTHISSLGSLDVDSARFVAAEILRGLEEIHRNEIVFVDLKPENVLVHQSNHIKLSDFGSSRFFNEVGVGRGEGGVHTADRLEGTADYLAPEVLRGEHAVSPASDLWAFACTLYQMLAGRTPIWAGDSNSNGAADAAAAQDKAASDSSLTPAERAAARDAAMAAHEAAQKSHMLSKMVQFEASDEDRFPDNFDPLARQLIEAIMVPDPAKRFGVKRRGPSAAADATVMEDGPSSASTAASASSSSSGGGVQWVVDYSVLKSHPFFSSLDFSALPTLLAPNLSGGQVAPAPADAMWARRKNSIMWAPMPKSYTFAEGSSVVMETIAEDIAKENAPPASVAAGASVTAAAPSAGARSLRAQMFSNKTGSLAAPRFGSLQESPEEGSDAMKLTEGDEEEEEGEDDEDEEEEDDDDEPMDGRGGGRLHGKMMAAPLPSSSSSFLPPRAPPKPSSRASGPMAVVETSREEEEHESAAGMISLAPLARPPAAANSSSSSSSSRAPAPMGGFGRRSNLPPPSALAGLSSSSGLPPTGIRPSASFVPRADATAGPTGLGMGLRRQMGGSSTSSALLARVLNQQSNMHPTTQLPDAQQQK